MASVLFIVLSIRVQTSQAKKLDASQLVPCFFLEWSVVQVSISGNDAREVLADLLIARKLLDLWGAIKAVVCANKKLFALTFYLNGSCTSY